jgi:hypothetical protein
VSERKDRIRIHIGGQEFNVVGGGFQEMLAAVKQINGRRFVSELKVWQLPGPVEEVQRQLEISGYSLEEGAPVAASIPSSQTMSSTPGGDRIRVLVAGKRLAVVGGAFQEMLAVVKNLPGRRFDSETKLWEISGDPGVIRGMIEAAGFQLEGATNIPLGPVAPMERPDFSSQSGERVPLPFEEPNFFDDDEIPEPPPWWDEEMAPPPVENDYFDNPALEPEPLPTAAKPPTSSPVPAASGRRSGGDRIRVRLGDLPLVVSGGAFQDMLMLIKSIPGRRFNGDERVWEIPDEVSLESLGQRISAAGFALEQE